MRIFLFLENKKISVPKETYWWFFLLQNIKDRIKILFPKYVGRNFDSITPESQMHIISDTYFENKWRPKLWSDLSYEILIKKEREEWNFNSVTTAFIFSVYRHLWEGATEPKFS